MLSLWNLKSCCRVLCPQDSITDAVFADEVYYTLEAMYNKCSYAERKDESHDEIVADTYDALKQLVSE